MDQFVPADWSSGKMGDTFGPSCDQEDGLVELLWCRSHVAMHSQLPPPRPTAREHEAEPCFQYPVDEDPLDKDLFWKFFGEMPAEGTCRLARSDTAGYSVATPYHDASKMVTSSSTRPRAPGGVKRKHRDTAGGEIPSEVMQDAGESDSAADAAMTCGRTKGKRRRAAQEHNLSERRRRDRINEKMRALQELVPHCNKTDKASMLDEAIRYLKSLQLQVKMMWTTGAGMAPASGAHWYMQRIQ